MKSLYLVPARGGSKGIPGKNIKPLNGKPLIYYTIEFARQFVNDEDICVSTDSDDIISVTNAIGLNVPFKRPDHLATDTSSSFDVILHSLQYYKEFGFKEYDIVILLQPTSPLREKWHLEQALSLFATNSDMVVSVYESGFNPYYNLYEINSQGFLELSKKTTTPHTRRQDIPEVYAYNGSMYIINVKSLYQYKSLDEFPRIRHYKMDKKYSIDLDTLSDWQYCEFLLRDKKDAEK